VVLLESLYRKMALSMETSEFLVYRMLVEFRFAFLRSNFMTVYEG
jgi:hypothetical protein